MRGRKHPLFFLYMVSKNPTLKRILMIRGIGQLVKKTQRQKDFPSSLQNSFFWIIGSRDKGNKLALKGSWLRMSKSEPMRENINLERKLEFRCREQRVA